ncbi:MAG: hypothetical protein ACOX9C_07860 [Kiritimatiellia bacterium]|jgi:hypothetical protein
MDKFIQLAGTFALPGILTISGVVCLFPIILGRHLFTLTFRADYLLEVYVRNTVHLSSEAVLEGQRIARSSAESAHENN